jgi:hypothetical protein
MQAKMKGKGSAASKIRSVEAETKVCTGMYGF